jgi:phosphoribosylformylglycinamidine cyclo-ligase
MQRLGDVEQREMDQVFNMGLGLVMVVNEFYADSIQKQLSDLGEQSFRIGRIDAGERGVRWA